MAFQVGDDLIEQRGTRACAAAIDQTLAANLHDVDPGQDRIVRRCLGRIPDCRSVKCTSQQQITQRQARCLITLAPSSMLAPILKRLNLLRVDLSWFETAPGRRVTEF